MSAKVYLLLDLVSADSEQVAQLSEAIPELRLWMCWKDRLIYSR